MPHEKPPSEEQPSSGMSRKKFLVTAAAAVGVGALAYLEREKLGIGALPDVRKEYAAKREALNAQYEKTGELPDLSSRTELILLHDLEAYMERDARSKRISSKDFKGRYDAFSAQVMRDAADDKNAGPVGLPKSRGLDKLLRLKSAFQKNAGTTYNRSSDSVADPIVEQRHQCRSGTLGLLLLALEAAEREKGFFADGETLVSVYTEGHVAPALLLKDGTLVALEMTSAGNGVRNFGKMTDIKGPIRVVRADHGTYQEALDTAAHRDKAVLFDTVPKGEAKGGSVRHAARGQFGFGEPKVAEGDLPMPSANVLPSEDVFDESRLFNRMERVQSEKELLQIIISSEEREFVRDYLIHHRTVINYYNAYVEIFNQVENITEGNRNKRVTRQEFLAAEREIIRLADSIDAYARANNLDEQYVKSQQILAKYSSSVSVRMATIAPGNIANVMRNNLELLRRSR